MRPGRGWSASSTSPTTWRPGRTCWTPTELAEAEHADELVAREWHWLHLDVAVHPLGSAACGPPPLPERWLRPQEFQLGLTFRRDQTGAAGG
ncbi:hypothetical protein CGZ93_00060 [Enemella dayhoffiae]|uniref:Beta galactosidase small chain/ domain-containing protein n=1 Tax=Enemella dayhoffiae TaxID=2016507 RepID=A0A255HAW9_9ACTN|nr:hypothetical protein CGZ93_00060 [Enemella dayhoffiae]